MMASQQQLKDAHYTRHDNYIEDLGQCGFLACDHSKILTDEQTGEEYRYCMKLQMPVDSYDSCKYHSQKEASDLLMQWASLSKEAEKKASNPPQKAKKRVRWVPVIIALICVILIWYIFLK